MHKLSKIFQVELTNNLSTIIKKLNTIFKIEVIKYLYNFGKV